MNEKNSRLVWIYLLYDVSIIVVSFLGSIYLKFKSFDAGQYYLILPLIVLIWIVVVLRFTSQNYYLRVGLYRHFRSQVLDFMIFVGIVSTLMLVLDLKLYSRLVLFGTIFQFFVLRNLGILMIYKYLRVMRSRGRHVKRMLVVGGGRLGNELYQYLKRDPTLGYSIVGFLDDNPVKAVVPEKMVLGKRSDFEQVIHEKNVQEVILAIPLTATSEINQTIATAEFHGLRISMIPDYYRLMERPFETRKIGPLPLVSIREIALDNLLNKALKRGFDIIFSGLALIFISPLLVVLSVLIKLESKGPVLYRPIRVGLGGNEFECLKFRSMLVDNSPDHNTKSTQKNDPRITKLGAILRKYSLDELPQFVNVFRGDMSVVGPRPHRTFLNEDMQKKVKGYMMRHYIKPGITGWAQVNGWRGPTNTEEQKSERTRHDLWYMENWTFWLDIRIILMTLFGKSKENAF
ncbi:MAG: undecaprenyl-phosphate glucose phosphotransferase [Flavobacteriales bacterium]